MQKETRFLETAELEIRADGDKPCIRGYASVFNSPSLDLGGFREIVLPGAFRASLESGDDCLGTFNHDPDKLLGRRSSATLRLSEDARGLRFEIDPPDTSYARDLAESMKRGDVKGASFGFTVNKDGQDWKTEDGQRVRYLRSVRLLDVAVVTEPAYRDAAAVIRSIDELGPTARLIARARYRLRLASAALRA